MHTPVGFILLIRLPLWITMPPSCVHCTDQHWSARAQAPELPANQWSEDAIARLQGSLACTDWDVFEGSLEERVSVITDYIHLSTSLSVAPQLLFLHEKSIVQTVILYCSTCFYMLTASDRNTLTYYTPHLQNHWSSHPRPLSPQQYSQHVEHTV